MGTCAKLGEILKASKFGLYPLGKGGPARFINGRVTPLYLFLRKITLMAT